MPKKTLPFSSSKAFWDTLFKQINCEVVCSDQFNRYVYGPKILPQVSVEKFKKGEWRFPLWAVHIPVEPNITKSMWYARTDIFNFNPTVLAVFQDFVKKKKLTFVQPSHLLKAKTDSINYLKVKQIAKQLGYEGVRYQSTAGVMTYALLAKGFYPEVAKDDYMSYEAALFFSVLHHYPPQAPVVINTLRFSLTLVKGVLKWFKQQQLNALATKTLARKPKKTVSPEPPKNRKEKYDA